MKKALALAITALSLSANAQDVLVKRDGSTILSKVVEVGITEIKYKKWDNLDGPSYSISRKDIQSVNYQNGTRENFENENEDVEVQVKKTQAFLELDPTIGLTEGYKGSIGLKFGFTTHLNDNFKWGLGTGVEESFDFRGTPGIPVFMRFEYQADESRKGSMFALLDAGYLLFPDNMEAGLIELNPTIGRYISNYYLGIGYNGLISTKGGDSMHSIAFKLGYRFGKYAGSDTKRAEKKNKVKKVKFHASVGAAANGATVKYKNDEGSWEEKMGAGWHADIAWTRIINDHLDLGFGAGLRNLNLVHKFQEEWKDPEHSKFDKTMQDFAIPVFMRAEYTFFDKDKKIRPFARVDAGYMIGAGRPEGFYTQTQIGVKYKKLFANLGLATVPIALTSRYDYYPNDFNFADKTLVSPVFNIGIEL